jgi:dihydrofolate synthase/folylpolyglutamate synthase
MNFPESLEYLYNLGNEVLAMKLGLENIRKVLSALGNPEKKYLKVQIAGTNGKGSTVAFLESICAAANINVGSTTSPHLVSITERVKIGGAEIFEEDFARHATRVREVSENLVAAGELETVPTFFEQVTAIALNAFAEAKIDLAILETGLGGRFDATTAANAEIVAITPIDYDHQNILGETLSLIAAEKAAIIRADTKVFVAPQRKEAERVITGKCREVGVEPVFISSQIHIHREIDEWGIYPFPLETTLIANNKVYSHLKIKMLGRHQYRNAALAAVLAHSLNDFGFKFSSADIKSGLENATHKGRLEFYKGILFDGAHNVAGAKVLKDYLDEFIKQPITIIFGAMRDKDLTEIAKILFPKAETLILTESANARSVKSAELIKFVPKDFDTDKIIVTQTVEEALKIAPWHSMHGILCVTGSLYLVGEAQEILQNSF